MLVQGAKSLACVCESTSDFYNPAACDPEHYSAQFDRDPNDEDDVHDYVPYTVNVPYGYTFNGQVCDRLEFESLNRKQRYIPPLATGESLSIIEQGMRLVVVEGTAVKAALPYVNVAGKTGTAEYCDDIAYPKGLCVRGQWPSHGWFIAYAPYENPEIIVIVFVYNGGEGSTVGVPVARDVLEAYFRLKAQRAQTAPGQ
jgi:hypothetical protein